MSPEYGDDIAQTAAESTRNRLKNRLDEYDDNGLTLTPEEVRDLIDEDAHVPALSDGGPPLTWQDVQEMDEAAISANWQEVSKVLQRGPDAAPDTDTSTSEPLSWDVLKTMSPEQHIARKAEIDAWLRTHGGDA